MRKKCVAGNWKMHKTIAESRGLIEELLPGLERLPEVDSVVCPPFISLAAVSEAVKDSSIEVGAQNLYWEERGAFTGEISPGMVAEVARHVILGHSERRALFHDTDQSVNKKVLAALDAGLNPILCVGETLEENEAGKTGEVVKRQLTEGLKGVSLEDMAKMMIAYEPVWAIGTGKAATPEEANLIIKENIRDLIADLASSEISESIRILYGGSVKPENADDFFKQPDIDGALVGGASLKADAFVKITEAAA